MYCGILCGEHGQKSQTLAAKVQSVPLQQQVMSAVTFAEIRAGLKKRGAQLGAE
jgi:hypothetical protein